MWPPDGEKILKIYLFVLTWSTNVTDGQTDGHRMTAIAALMHSIACQKSTGNQLTLQVYRKDNCVRNTYKKLSYRWQTGFLSEYVDKKLTRDYNVILYLSIFNSFWVIRCLSQCVSPKIAIFTTFFVSLGRPAKCCMDGKRIQAYKLSRCAHLTTTVSEIQRDSCEKIVILSYPLAFDAPVRGVPVGISLPRLVWKN